MRDDRIETLNALQHWLACCGHFAAFTYTSHNSIVSCAKSSLISRHITNWVFPLLSFYICEMYKDILVGLAIMATYALLLFLTARFMS
jgi:hypothetical protein